VTATSCFWTLPLKENAHRDHPERAPRVGVQEQGRSALILSRRLAVLEDQRNQRHCRLFPMSPSTETEILVGPGQYRFVRPVESCSCRILDRDDSCLDLDGMRFNTFDHAQQARAANRLRQWPLIPLREWTWAIRLLFRMKSPRPGAGRHPKRPGVPGRCWRTIGCFYSIASGPEVLSVGNRFGCRFPG